jgi:hypothetical protein
MARKPMTDRQHKSPKAVRSGFEKMQMNHRRTRELIRRIQTEAAERLATGKPVHVGFPHR